MQPGQVGPAPEPHSPAMPYAQVGPFNLSCSKPPLQCHDGNSHFASGPLRITNLLHTVRYITYLRELVKHFPRTPELALALYPNPFGPARRFPRPPLLTCTHTKRPPPGGFVLVGNPDLCLAVPDGESNRREARFTGFDNFKDHVIETGRLPRFRLHGFWADR
jgi:hypothetical protein